MNGGTLVLGIGNVFLSDEAVGVRVIQALQQRFDLPDNLDVIDGGTCGFELMADMSHREHIIVVDAVLAQDKAPGDILILKDKEVPAVFTRKISPHQLGLSDVLSALTMTDEFPDRITLIGIVPQAMDFKMELTPVVQKSMEEVLGILVQTLKDNGFAVTAKATVTNENDQ